MTGLETSAASPDATPPAAISCAELAALLSSSTPLLLLDIREQEEYAVSHIPGAVLLAPARVAAFAQAQASRLGEQLIVVYCSVGVRSAKAAHLLTAAGCSQVKNLSGAIFQWANEGQALAGGMQMHPFDAFWGQQLIESRRAVLAIASAATKPAA